MKSAPISTICPCGSPLNGDIKKPTQMAFTVTKVLCGCCGSYFLVKCFKSKTKANAIYFEAMVLELTAKGKQLFREMKAKEQEQEKPPEVQSP